MIMSLKPKKIKFRPRIKLDHNFSMERWGENNVVVTKKKLICFDSASHREQPTVPTFFLLSDTTKETFV